MNNIYIIYIFFTLAHRCNNAAAKHVNSQMVRSQSATLCKVRSNIVPLKVLLHVNATCQKL